MSEPQRQRFGLGVFVVVAVVLLGGLVISFGSLPSMFTLRSSYTLVFFDAPGVGPGTPVRRSGVKIGEVTKVDLDDKTGEVLVVAQIEPRFAPRSNEEPLVNQNLLNGNAVIDFILKVPPRVFPRATTRALGAPPTSKSSDGEPQQEPPPPPPPEPDRGQLLPPGSVIRGARQLDARNIIGTAADLIPSAERSLDAIRLSVERFVRLGPVLEETILEIRETARSVREMVPEVRKTNDNLIAVTQAARLAMPEVRNIAADARTAAGSISQTVKRVDDLLQKNQDKIVKAVDNLNGVLERANQVLGDENQANVKATLANIKKSSERLDGTLNSAEDFMKDARKSSAKLNETLTQADETVKELRQTVQRSSVKVEGILDDVKKTTFALADRTPFILKNVEVVSDQVGRLIGIAGEFLSNPGKAGGTVGKLFSDPELYNNLSDASLAAARLIQRLEPAVRDLQNFADKIARHPELIGIGGAVRPSGGLKESPFTPIQPSSQPLWGGVRP